MYRGFATAAALTAAVCVCAALAPSCVAAQQKQIPAELNGHATVAEIVLPSEMEMEKPATLAVIDSDGRLVEGVTVLLPGGRKVTTDATGRARFVVTSGPGAFIAEVSASALQPRVRGYALVQAHPPTNSKSDSAGGAAQSSSAFTVTDYPSVLVHERPAEVRGYGFRGDAELDGVIVGAKPAMILAASPMGIVFQTASDTSVGPASLEIRVAGAKLPPLLVTIVSLEITPPAGPVVVGGKEKMSVFVTGTERKITLAVENLAPEVVELTAGDFHWVKSSGGKVNESVIEMRARQGGDFSVSVRMAPGGSATAPDLKMVRRELMAAQALTEGEWPARMDTVVVRMDQAERNPRNVTRLQQEIEKLLAEAPAAEVKRHLQQAWLVVSQR